MTRVSRDFGDTMQREAVPAVSADVIFASSRFPNYKLGTNNQIVEGKDDPRVLSMKEVVARETAQLLEQQNRLSVRDLASKFEKGLAAAAKLSEEARLREAASLEKHVLLKKLRDVKKKKLGDLPKRIEKVKFGLGLRKEKMPDMQGLVNEFLIKLKKRKMEGSQATAKQTAELLRAVISQQRVPYSNQSAALIDAVKSVGELLISANPIELAVGNIVRRVLHIIREEDLSLTTAAMAGLNLSSVSDDDDDAEHDDHPVLSAAAVAAAARSTLRPPSLQTLLEDVPDGTAIPRTSSSGGDSEGKSKSADKSSRTRKLKHDVIEAVNELIQDINTCHEQIAEQAVEHIHQNEVILTLGSSRTVLEFLCAAKEKKRSFRVFVAEGAPRYQGHLLAKELVSRGLQTTLITDSAVFAMISRVNMVIVGAHAVMANGGVIAPVGLNMVALAAQRHAVPFVVLAGSHKLCPLYPHNPEVLLNELRSPSELLDFGEFSECMDFGNGAGSPLLHVVNPTFDYVPPKLVSLFITDTGGHNPSYMYRLIADYYSADDLVVQRRTTTGS